MNQWHLILNVSNVSSVHFLYFSFLFFLVSLKLIGPDYYYQHHQLLLKNLDLPLQIISLLSFALFSTWLFSIVYQLLSSYPLFTFTVIKLNWRSIFQKCFQYSILFLLLLGVVGPSLNAEDAFYKEDQFYVYLLLCMCTNIHIFIEGLYIKSFFWFIFETMSLQIALLALKLIV